MAFITRREFNQIVEAAQAWYESNTPDLSKKYIDLYTQAYIKDKGPDQGEVIEHSARKVFSKAQAKAGLDNYDEFKSAFISELNQELIIGDPVFIVIDKLNAHIKELESEWDFSSLAKEIKKQKIDTLKLLVQTLLTGKLQSELSSEEEREKEDEESNQITVGELIRSWEYNFYEALNPRDVIRRDNIFNVEKVSDSTATANLIAELKSKYGSKLIDTSVARDKKQGLLQPFVDYLNSRLSWLQRIITFFFRNESLSTKKIELVEEIVSEIKDSEDSYKNLIGLLQVQQRKHTQLSRLHGKDHDNLEQDIKVIQLDRKEFIKEDESTKDYDCSELADAFHSSLRMNSSI